MRIYRLFGTVVVFCALVALVCAQESSGGCPACVVIQSQQGSETATDFAELTVPKGTLTWFMIGSGDSKENEFRSFFKTGMTDRFDLGLGYSRYGERVTLQVSYQLARQSEQLPVGLLVGYGFSSTYTRQQEGFYAMGVHTTGNLSLMGGWQHLRNGRDIGFVAGNYRLNDRTALMFYSHQPTMTGEALSYNLALVHRIGDWRVGVWWFHPNRESDVGFSLSRSFTLR